MSIEGSPVFGQLPQAPPEVLLDTYAEYINALVANQPDVMTFAASLLSPDMPFVPDVQECTRSYAAGNNEERKSRAYKSKILRVALRSYIYSGITINQDVIRNAVCEVGEYDAWVRKTAKPSRKVLRDLERQNMDRKCMKELGKRAMAALDVDYLLLREVYGGIALIPHY